MLSRTILMICALICGLSCISGTTYAGQSKKTIPLSPDQVFQREDPALGIVLCAYLSGAQTPVSIGRVKGDRYERLYSRKLAKLVKKQAAAVGAVIRRAIRKKIKALKTKRALSDAVCRLMSSSNSSSSVASSGTVSSDEAQSSSSSSRSYAFGGPVEPLDIDNTKSGISISLSGEKGVDWAVEHTFHDVNNGDQIIFIKSNVAVSLAHNENNTLMKRDSVALPAVLGISGPDGIPNSGDEGDIYYKIDRDMQAHRYSTKANAQMPSFTPLYTTPLRFDELTYDGTMSVLGSIGDNGGAWGSEASNTTARFGYGQRNAAGDECHTLTFWDDDEPLFRGVSEDSHRQGASDGHWVLFCIDPITPVIQLQASVGQQYYTTPLKTYHIPKIWEQTSYVTEGVEIGFLNLRNSEPIYFRIDGGPWELFQGRNFVAGSAFTKRNEASLLEVKAGWRGGVLQRRVVLEPDYPGQDEQHGYLLWGSDQVRETVVNKVHTVQPFARSYGIFLDSYYQGATEVFGLPRGGWCSGASRASTALANAFAAAIDGPAAHSSLSALGKQRLLRLARLEPVGNEEDVNAATPAKDYLNELGQTIQGFADAGVAYDLMAKYFRASQDPNGMTPIEELRIRDGLAEIAKTTLQHRDNYGFVHGGGDSHWPLGYEITLASIALSMPSYKTPYFGVSGGDFTSINDLVDENGKYWNPFPDQGISWYQAATDPEAPRPGYPNNAGPPRAEFLFTDDGYWTGANDLQGDGDRYVTGPAGTRLVDVLYGGLANAENRVEMVEMAGYESPFTARLQIVEYMRRLKGDGTPRYGLESYFQRRLIGGYTPLGWNAALKRYEKQPPHIASSVYVFNPLFSYSALASPKALVEEYLHYLMRYYGYEPGTYPSYIEDERKTLYGAYALALFSNPSDISHSYSEPNHAPIIKPTFKYVVKPGETIFKEIIVTDPDDDTVTLNVSGLPAGALYDDNTRTITWTPGVGDTGVYMVWLTASDGQAQITRPFPIMVKADAGSGPIPTGPTNLTVATDSSWTAHLSWSAPQGLVPAYYVIYRDGSLQDVVPGTQVSYVDREPLPVGSHTRYSVALYVATGAESSATSAGIVSVPRQ